jgi:hypothetical protein
MAHLPHTLVIRLLRDPSFQPGARPIHFSGPCPGPDGTPSAGGWLFKEVTSERSTRRPSGADRWRNTGGAKGARNLHMDGPPQLRRRYGKVLPAEENQPLLDWERSVQPVDSTKALRLSYHEYTLLGSPEGSSEVAEDKSAYLFHVVPTQGLAAAVPRLGLPASVKLSRDESTELTAILRGESYQTAGEELAGSANEAAAAMEATEADDLPVEELVRMLCDTEFEPGRRPPLLDPARYGWVFKESGKQPRRGKNMDRWKHSGGVKGARDIQLNGVVPVVRRRYGVIIAAGTGTVAFRFHQYSLLAPPAAGQDGCSFVEDSSSPVLFHVQRRTKESKNRKKFPELTPLDVAQLPIMDSQTNRVPKRPNAARLETAKVVKKRRRTHQVAVVVVAQPMPAESLAAASVGDLSQLSALPRMATADRSSLEASAQGGGVAGGPGFASGRQTSLQEAMAWLGWWQGSGDNYIPHLGGDHRSGAGVPFRRTRSSFGSLSQLPPMRSFQLDLDAP